MPLYRRALLGSLLATPALAQLSGGPIQPSAPGGATAIGPQWPQHPIRLVVPFAAGGAADSAARAITPKMGEVLGQGFVIENRTGAGGSLGGGVVAAAAADGHTLLWDASSHLVNPALMKALPFDYASAFTPISQVVTFPGVLAVKTDFPARSVAEFIALAKAQPGRISIGTQGNATAGHIGLLQFSRLAGIEVIHVPYRGGADAARDLAAGTVDGVFITTVSSGPVVDAGRGHFLAVTTLHRVPSRPEVPTLAESGFPGFDSNEWAGFFAPAGLAEPIRARLFAALEAALADPGVRQRLAQIGAVPVGSNPAAFSRFCAEGRAAMAQLVREANIRLE